MSGDLSISLHPHTSHRKHPRKGQRGLPCRSLSHVSLLRPPYAQSLTHVGQMMDVSSSSSLRQRANSRSQGPADQTGFIGVSSSKLVATLTSSIRRDFGGSLRWGIDPHGRPHRLARLARLFLFLCPSSAAQHRVPRAESKARQASLGMEWTGSFLTNCFTLCQLYRVAARSPEVWPTDTHRFRLSKAKMGRRLAAIRTRIIIRSHSIDG